MSAILTPTMAPMPDHLVMTGSDQRLRRRRIEAGAHRVWEILPRYGTEENDRWTLQGRPFPAASNLASAYEDGQFSSLAEAYAARDHAELLDNGEHEED